MVLLTNFRKNKTNFLKKETIDNTISRIQCNRMQTSKIKKEKTMILGKE